MNLRKLSCRCWLRRCFAFVQAVFKKCFDEAKGNVMTVFVTDGAERTSLAITRSLGRKGIEVHSGESYRFSTTTISKYCKKSFIYPDPQIDCNNFIDRLVDILKDGDYDGSLFVKGGDNNSHFLSQEKAGEIC